MGILFRWLGAAARLGGWLAVVASTATTGFGQAMDTTSQLVAKPGCDVPCQAAQLLLLFQQRLQVPGVQLAVSVRGQTILSQGFGYADVTRQLPVTPATRFRIGSISKSLTAAAVLELVAEKRLDLDAPIQRYVPTFPRQPFSISTRQLAGHLAGIRHYNPQDPHDANRAEHYQTTTQALSIFEHDPLLFAPGTQYHYSSYGWNVIGAVIEGITGQEYLSYMRRTIWQPLGMVHTYGDRADSLLPGRSVLYQNNGRPIAYDDMSSKYPSGGLLSTADDLVLYGNSLLANTLFAPRLTRLLFTPQTTSTGRPTHYGVGWHIGRTAHGRRVYWHNGLVTGGSGYLLLYPDDTIVVALLANSRRGHGLPAQALGDLLVESYRGK